MNSTGRSGMRRNYSRSIGRYRSRIVHVTPARIFFRRIGNRLDGAMGALIIIAAASVVVTLIAGVAAFAITVLPDRGGVERISIPNYLGQSYENLVADEEIYNVVIEYKFDDSHPAGTVIEQYPAAGSLRMIKEGERLCELILTLSRGTETIILPDCTGVGSSQAELELKSLGLRVNIVGQYSETVKYGEVISTSPAAFSDLPAGGTVTVYVSMGENLDMVVVPALSGLGEAAAITKLLSLGLLAGQTEYVKSSAPAGTVIAQSAPFGSEVRAGTKVSLTVSIGS